MEKVVTKNIETIFVRKLQFLSKHVQNKMKKKVPCDSLKDSEGVVSI